MDEICDQAACIEPAVTLIKTARIGATVSKGLVTSICWDIEDRPAKGWRQATPVCARHRELMLVQLARTLG